MIEGDTNWSGENEIIGELETSVGALLGARKQMLMDKLSRNGSEKLNGLIIVRVEPVSESH